MINLLQQIWVLLLGGITGRVVDVGGRHADADTAFSRDDEHVDAQEKINMFEITPYTGPFHPYTGPSYPYSATSHPYSDPSHPFSPLCSHCKCKECKDRMDKILEKLEVITKVVEKLKSKRGVIPSNKVRESYTPTVEVGRKKRAISQILSNLKPKKNYNSSFSKSC
ncbi:hypothetical protein FXO38_11558 [Capsicum annuum]|nr:hypothetical protein FXO38_11558 [Capsicum annuum]